MQEWTLEYLLLGKGSSMSGLPTWTSDGYNKIKFEIKRSNCNPVEWLVSALLLILAVKRDEIGIGYQCNLSFEKRLGIFSSSSNQRTSIKRITKTEMNS